MINPNTGLLAAGLAAAGLAAWGATKIWIETYRYIRATPLQRKRIHHGFRVRITWKRTARNLGLAKVDEVTKGREDFTGKKTKPVVVVPKIKVFPEPWGLRIMVKTILSVGLEEFEKAAGWLADTWGCERVEIIRTKPGVLEVRAVVGQPLDTHRPWDLWLDELALQLGRNTWGRSISLPLRELSGIKVSGMPGFGKSTLLMGWVAQLAKRSDVQFAVFDGKTADPRYGTWAGLGERALFVVGDNPETANQRLTDVVRLLKDRPAALTQERGTHKFWKLGPTDTNPLVLVVMDEVHNYSDTKGLTGAAKAVIESNQRLMQVISKEGRELGVIGIFSTQKQTSDAIPTAVRDNLEVGISFATFTIEAAEAALGAAIRKETQHDPTALNQKPRYVGVAVATGVPGLDGRYDTIRVDDLDEDLAEKFIAAGAHWRRDVIPLPAPVVRDASEAGRETADESVPLRKPAARRSRKAS